METGTASSPQIKYCSIEDRYLPELEDLLVHGFVTGEPTFHLCRNLEGSLPDANRGWARETLRQHDWRVSRVAVDAATGRVVGAMLNDTGSPAQPGRAMSVLGQELGTEPSRLVYGVVHQLEQRYDVFKALGADRVLQINIGVVDPKYRRQGISLELRRQSLEMARQHGCQAAMDDASSPYTRKALSKLGFTTVMFLPYTESILADSGKVDLSECGPEDGMALMVRRL